MFDASLMSEEFRPSVVFEKEVLLNYAEASRWEAPVKKSLPGCNSDKVRRRLMRKQEARRKAEQSEPAPKLPRDQRARHGMYRH